MRGTAPEAEAMEGFLADAKPLGEKMQHFLSSIIQQKRLRQYLAGQPATAGRRNRRPHPRTTGESSPAENGAAARCYPSYQVHTFMPLTQPFVVKQLVFLSLSLSFVR